MMQEPEALWTRILKHKYCKRWNGVHHLESGRKPSSTWKGICEMRNILQRGGAYSIGDGMRTLFWTQRWATSKPLIEVTTTPIPTEAHGKVEEFAAYIPREIQEQLTAYQVYPEASIGDKPFWGETDSGAFSMTSAIKLMRDDTSPERQAIWTLLWRIEAPQQTKTFLWLVLHDAMITNAARVRRGFASNAYCAICQDEVEDIDHRYRDLIESPGWEVLLGHCYREANQVADRLANMGVELNYAIRLFTLPPVEVAPLMYADTIGTKFPRVIIKQ
ncbi:hypothetical protein Cgig2_007466 [Carnegiea gigantea]|uniref:Reverse transcriptase zinc-binding domain-containing protein n=1 Tax=Carnegiea gigantea TaxID=171969 RepID=A0A9Q1QD96_9CARY|nr:hypothetical protein Cgig2_007466 [Carnegiea gigantea]